jgi:uncharacterized protein YifN (PemK superfamily)
MFYYRTSKYIPSKAGQVLNFTDAPLLLPESNNTFGRSPFTNNRTGHVVLVQHGEYVMDQKVAMAGNTGAIVVVVCNHVDGELPPLVDNKDVIPLVGIQKADGEALIAPISTDTNSKAVRAIFESTARYIVNTEGGMVSNFSSWNQVHC